MKSVRIQKRVSWNNQHSIEREAEEYGHLSDKINNI